MLKVYTINECPWCVKVKKYLKSKNVEFEELNIEEDEAAREACQKLTGDLIVPITTADDKEYAVSFDKEKLDAILQSM